MAEGARLESVFRGNSNVGSNPTLSARLFCKSCKINQIQTNQQHRAIAESGQDGQISRYSPATTVLSDQIGGV